jgi:hypothetical protein
MVPLTSNKAWRAYRIVLAKTDFVVCGCVSFLRPWRDHVRETCTYQSIKSCYHFMIIAEVKNDVEAVIDKLNTDGIYSYKPLIYFMAGS